MRSCCRWRDRAGPSPPYGASARRGWKRGWSGRPTSATKRFMPLFGHLSDGARVLVYRSWRALGAIILTLGAVVAMAVGLAELFGWSNTVVSTLVPLTVMVTTTATLVYIHSRYIEPDDSPTLLEHHARALANKFLPCTASMFATAVGFAALAVSDIRPVREMGLWTACGLIVAWVGCFTLFPALQSLLRTPLRSERRPAASGFHRFVDVLWCRRRVGYRWPLVGGVAGADALRRRSRCSGFPASSSRSAAGNRCAHLRQPERAGGPGHAAASSAPTGWICSSCGCRPRPGTLWIRISCAPSSS